MSKKTDLLVRVRYENPLPPPPFPPKLVDIPTSLSRYGQPSYVTQLIRETPYPMMVDAECGMPLDLLNYKGLWEGGGTDEINPTGPLPTLDADDSYLLSNPDPIQPQPSLSSSNSLDPSGSVPAAPSGGHIDIHSHVSWLRKTEYIQKDAVRATAGVGGLKGFKRPVQLDRSLEGQYALIEKTFSDLEKSDLKTLRHPNKPGLTAVEEYDVLPDPQTWATGYSLFKFVEPPASEGIAGADAAPNASLSSAIFRPILDSDGEQSLVYYVPETAEADEEALKGMRTDQPESTEPVRYIFARNYELAGTGAALAKGTELALIICEADEEGDVKAGEAAGGKRKRGKGAYFHEFISKTTIKRKRIKKNSPPSNPVWDEINLFLETPTEDVLALRNDESKVVDDPSWEPPKEEEEEQEQEQSHEQEGSEHEQESENGSREGMEVDS
ncbi:RNA polymerase II-associated [Mrakia frigida]|uniref:Paf1p n=1 Tax=Mrakia frigida TaxID=29902 RepID=UPI003FCC16B0